MKKVMSIILLGLMFTAQGAEYTKSVKSFVHSGQAESRVILDGNKVYIEHENAEGFSCYFDGMYDNNDGTEKTRYEAMDSESNCSVDLLKNSRGDISITSNGNCIEFCGAGAELKVEGLVKK